MVRSLLASAAVAGLVALSGTAGPPAARIGSPRGPVWRPQSHLDTAALSARETPRLDVGKLLVARRELPDPNFAKTVVLLLRYGEGGAMGVVINRPSDVPVSSLAGSIQGLAARDEPIFIGGPVPSDSLFLLVRATEPPRDATRVFEDVWVTQSAETLRDLVEQEPARADLRLYAGYAGWAGGQLDLEVERGDWHILPADSRAIFDDAPARVWDELVPPLPTQQARAEPFTHRAVVTR